MRQKIASIAQKLRLPSICALCHQYHAEQHAICLPCYQLLIPIGPACTHCALPLPDRHTPLCGHCCKKKPAIDQTIAAYQFVEPLRSLLHEFKYHEGLYLSSLFASMIVDAISNMADRPQCLIPIPMHPKRLRQRGFNQAAEIAKKLGRALQLPYDMSHCKKIINTPPQAFLNAKQRRHNLQKAFSSNPLPYQHVALVDDLLTTGSTANELAKVLKNQGVERVDVWCCARVVETHPK